MSKNQSTSPSPLLIGGSSAYACRLLGDFVNLLPEYDCGPPTHIFCHPKFWDGTSEDWSKICTKSMQAPESGSEGFLPWHKVYPQDFLSYYLPGLNIFDLLASSRDGEEFASQHLFKNRLTVSNAVTWAESTADNIFSANSFLNLIPDSQVILATENGYCAMTRLIKEGFSPKVAAKTWVIESSLAAALVKLYRPHNRVHLIRIEDLLADPETVLNDVTQFLSLTETNDNDTTKIITKFQHQRLPSSERDKILDENTRQQASLPSRYRDYLLGTTIKPDILPKFGFAQDTPFGAKLMHLFGYEESIKNWEPIKLSKEDHFLGSPQASFINPFADFKKSPQQKKVATIPEKKRLSFWRSEKNHADSVKTESPPPIFSIRKTVPASQSDSCKQPDLNPDLPEEELDFAIVIAFFGRHEILDLVVRELMRLRKCGFTVGIFLVCSEETDFEFARDLRDKLGGIGVRTTPNHPLGRKWQAGVDFARQWKPKHLVITGSDDLISTNFLNHAAELLSDNGPAGGFEFAAPASWFLYEVDDESLLQGSLWELSYRNPSSIPLGAGRVYSSRLLDRFDWKLFDEERNSGLDNQGFQQVINVRGRTVLIPSQKGVILSVKGGWRALNPTDKILSVPTIQCRVCDFEKEQFFLDHFESDSASIRDKVQPSVSPT